MDVLGDDYIAQHIQQQASREAAERRYRAYLTDSLYCITQGLSALTVGQTGRMARRWIEGEPDWVDDTEPERSAEQIIADLKAKINGEEETHESI